MKTSENQELEELFEQYDWQGNPIVIPGPSGMNNITHTVKDDDSLYIIRIYNNHSDQHKLTFEHRMLMQLQGKLQQFSVPLPIYNRAGSTITALHSGKLAACFRHIKGDRPKTTNKLQMLSLARATAQLSLALENITTDEAPAYSPYYELAQNYPVFDEVLLSRLLSDEAISSLERELRLVQQERVYLESLKTDISKLPHQWIHGDVNCSNALALGNDIVAILDFEFVTRDVRMMELAVLLSELIHDNNQELTGLLTEMIERYTEELALLPSELAMLYDLIKLRSVDVAMHFIVRYEQGLDQPDVLCNIMRDSASTISYVNQHFK